MTDELRARGNLVDLVGSGIREGGSALDTVPALMKRLLAEEGWRDFVTRMGEHVQHERFSEFVEAAPLAGLGATTELVGRLVADDDDAVVMLREALKEKPGPKRSGHNIHRSPKGTSRSYALQRLRQDKPELHADVLAGRLSAHGAMVKAGFRPKTVSVPVGRPESVAASLRKYMTPDDIARLIALLMREDL